MKKTMTSVVSLGTLAVASTLAFASGTAGAATPDAPAPTPDKHTMAVPLGAGMQYVGNTEDGSASLQTPFGTVTTRGAEFQIADSQGRVLAGPQNFDVAPKALSTVPAAALAPAQTAAAVTPDRAAAAAPVDDDSAPDPTADFNSALGQAATQFGLATGVGGLAGGVAGAALGCGLGILTGGTLSAVVSVGTLTPLGVLGGCLLGGSTVGGVGTILGGAALGIPVGIASAVQMYNTLHAKGEM